MQEAGSREAAIRQAAAHGAGPPRWGGADAWCAMVAHDLKSPLTVVKGVVALLRECADDPGREVAPLLDLSVGGPHGAPRPRPLDATGPRRRVGAPSRRRRGRVARVGRLRRVASLAAGRGVRLTVPCLAIDGVPYRPPRGRPKARSTDGATPSCGRTRARRRGVDRLLGERDPVDVPRGRGPGPGARAVLGAVPAVRISVRDEGPVYLPMPRARSIRSGGRPAWAAPAPGRASAGERGRSDTGSGSRSRSDG